MSFSSMYIATTGMIALSTGMRTISNNLANIETNGYKTMRTNYSDLFYSDLITTAPWPQQKGHGSQVQSVQSMFTQGAFRTTESPLDLALAGDGFFSVRTRLSQFLPASERIAYTREGAYTMDKNGYLVDPSGNILQGWAMSLPRPGETPVRLGSPVDVQITVMTIPPQATTLMRQAINLDADAQPAYYYSAYGLAEKYAREQAEAAAQSARGAAELAAWNPAVNSAVTMLWNLTPSNKTEFNSAFIKRYTEMFNPQNPVLDFDDPASVSLMGITEGTPDRDKGQMTREEFETLTALALADMDELAAERGEAAWEPAALAVWDTEGIMADPPDKPVTPVWDAVTSAWILSASNKYEFNQFFLESYTAIFDPLNQGLVFSDLNITEGTPDRDKGEMTLEEFNNLITPGALAKMNDLAAQAADSAKAAAQWATWNSDDDPTDVSTTTATLAPSNKYEFNEAFVNRYKEMFNLPTSALGFGGPAAIVSGMRLVTPPPDPTALKAR